MYSLYTLKIIILENKAFLITLRGFWHAIWCYYWDLDFAFLYALVRTSLCEKKNNVFEYLLLVNVLDHEVRRHFPG